MPSTTGSKQDSVRDMADYTSNSGAIFGVTTDPNAYADSILEEDLDIDNAGRSAKEASTPADKIDVPWLNVERADGQDACCKPRALKGNNSRVNEWLADSKVWHKVGAVRKVTPYRGGRQDYHPASDSKSRQADKGSAVLMSDHVAKSHVA
jgi:hypothetical protein